MKPCKHGKLFCGECRYGKMNENYEYRKDDLTVDFNQHGKKGWGKAINTIKEMRNGKE